MLIKIDVEGFETEVLNGSSQILSKENLKAIIIELNGSGARYGFSELKIHEKLLSNGFEAFKYDPLNRSLLAIETFGSQNTIYIKDVDFVSNRINLAQTFNIHNITF